MPINGYCLIKPCSLETLSLMSLALSIIMSIVSSASPLLLAALGELVCESAGVLNLGLEGLMLIGAVTGFMVSFATGSTVLGALAAPVAGALAAALFAVLTLKLLANQVATGLALALFGTGLSALLGASFVGHTVARLPALFPATLSADPSWRVLFGYDALVYMSLALVPLTAQFLRHTRMGLIMRAVGENDEAAHALGYDVVLTRFLATLYGGALAGLAGAYFSLCLTPMWAERLTAGRGWIALALVVFAAWQPWRLLAGALLFGAVMTLELHAKASGLHLLPPEILAMMPYLATILALTLIAIRQKTRFGLPIPTAPKSLGHAFKA